MCVCVCKSPYLVSCGTTMFTNCLFKKETLNESLDLYIVISSQDQENRIKIVILQFEVVDCVIKTRHTKILWLS